MTKFPAVPVTSLEDATLNMEKLQALGVLGSKIASDAQVAVGQGAASWAASVTSGVVTISHGLGRVPTVVLAMDVAGHGVWYAALNLAASTFQVFGQASSSVTLTTTFCWLAIG